MNKNLFCINCKAQHQKGVKLPHALNPTIRLEKWEDDTFFTSLHHKIGDVECRRRRVDGDVLVLLEPEVLWISNVHLFRDLILAKFLASQLNGVVVRVVNLGVYDKHLAR